METKFNVGEKVFIKGEVLDIKITKDTIVYSVMLDEKKGALRVSENNLEKVKEKENHG